MDVSTLTLRPAAPADIGRVMAIERSPEFELSVGRSDEAEHRAMLDSPSHAYRLGIGAGGAIEAFAILRGLGNAHANLYLKRVAVAHPGRGLGTSFLSLVLDEAFGPMAAERFYLDCFADNARAQAAYRKLGFTRDGILRQAYRLADGTGADLVIDGDPEERVAGARTVNCDSPGVGRRLQDIRPGRSDFRKSCLAPLPFEGCRLSH
jgi:ribosomal protein S18 acetylase RimI-like enzyme